MKAGGSSVEQSDFQAVLHLRGKHPDRSFLYSGKLDVLTAVELALRDERTHGKDQG